MQAVTTSEPDLKLRTHRRQWLWLVLLVVALYVLLPQLGSFRHSLSTLRGAQMGDILIAVLLTLLSYLFAAATYCFLASRSLVYGRTVVVQFAATFINRLLPAGIGSLGVNYAYLRKAGHPPGAAGSIVAVNNLLGFMGHSLLVAGLLAVYYDDLPPLHLVHPPTHAWTLLIGGLLTALVVGVAFSQRQRFRKGLTQIGQQLSYYQHRPWRLLLALLSSIGVTLCTVSTLWFCTAALHSGLAFLPVLLVFSFGIGLGAVTPTPGGLGGIEAGLVAGLVAYHMPSAEALAAVLAYRLINYWLTLAIGAAVFPLAQKRHYI